jgi:uncharacterized phage protein gp47/JayE
MPFARPKLTTLEGQVAADVTGELTGADPLLRFSNLNIIVKAQAKLAHGQYGYLKWIADQSTPFGATDPSYQSAWGALRGVSQKPWVQAVGTAAFTGTDGTVVPSGTALIRGDQVVYVTTAAITLLSGGVAPIQASVGGAAGNAAAGVALTLGSPIAGVNPAAVAASIISGGLDVELPATFKARYLQRYASPPQGGARGDYPGWALTVPGVTRAWIRPNGFGPGTVVVYSMLDVANAGAGGIPNGTDGVATAELRGAVATGDQLVIANAIFPLQPAEALVYSCAPVLAPQAFTLANMPAAYRSLVGPAISALFTAQATPGGVYLTSGVAGLVPIANIWNAIALATGWYTFQITSPTADIQTGTGLIASLGTLTFSG